MNGDIIKIDLTGIEGKSVDWIYLAQVRVVWEEIVITLIKLRSS